MSVAVSGPDVVSKGEFAAMIGVSPARVSQMLSEGKIDSAALVGQGRMAKIRVSLARRQIRERTDVGQALGNGITTRVDVEDDEPGFFDEPGSPSKRPAGGSASVDVQIRAQKLEQLQRQNRTAAAAELAAQGTYVRADQVKAGLAKVAGTMVGVFEGALADLASAIAAQFSLPQRDVLHLLTKEFRTVRKRAAEAARKAAETQPALVADLIADDDAEG